jgi:hypothetical protein
MFSTVPRSLGELAETFIQSYDLIQFFAHQQLNLRLLENSQCMNVYQKRSIFEYEFELYIFIFLGLRQENETLDVEKMKKQLEPELLDCISKLLEDSSKQVQLTAAVTLCSLNISEPKVSKGDEGLSLDDEDLSKGGPF